MQGKYVHARRRRTILTRWADDMTQNAAALGRRRLKLRGIIIQDEKLALNKRGESGPYGGNNLRGLKRSLSFRLLLLE